MNNKTMIISGLLLYDSFLSDIRVNHAKNDFHFDKNLIRIFVVLIIQIGKDLPCACAHF